MSRQQLKEKGFTIIEVVLVLAIAALIFLMVFIALPALQRNQRDQDRKTVLGKVAGAISSYQSTNRGQQPTTPADLAGYVDGKDDGTNVTINNNYILKVTGFGDGINSGEAGEADKGTIQVVTGAKCQTETTPTAAINTVIEGTSREAAIVMKMENGDALFCQSV